MTKETLKEYFKNSFIKENVIMLNVFDKLTEEEFDLFYNLFRFKLQEQEKQFEDNEYKLNENLNIGSTVFIKSSKKGNC